MRVTLDLDNKNWYDLQDMFFKVIKYTGKIPEIRKSARRGYHLIIKDLFITFEESLKIRELCGEDQRRIEFDKLKVWNKPKQVLFCTKRFIRG